MARIFPVALGEREQKPVPNQFSLHSMHLLESEAMLCRLTNQKNGPQVPSLMHFGGVGLAKAKPQ